MGLQYLYKYFYEVFYYSVVSGVTDHFCYLINNIYLITNLIQGSDHYKVMYIHDVVVEQALNLGAARSRHRRRDAFEGNERRKWYASWKVNAVRTCSFERKSGQTVHSITPRQNSRIRFT